MKLYLFSHLPFEVPDPIALIESYCIQSDFYENYDLVPLEERKVEDANKIGARINKKLLPRCKNVVETTRDLKIFRYNLDEFLDDLDDDKRNDYLKDYNEKAIRRLLKIKGLGLSKATKVFHTIYPRIIPIIDNPLSKVYHKEVNGSWMAGEPEIFVDYYDNLKADDNRASLNTIAVRIAKRTEPNKSENFRHSLVVLPASEKTGRCQV